MGFSTSAAKYFSCGAGIISAMLIALSVFHIEYSLQARSYSLLVLLVTCSYLFFVRDAQTGGREGGLCNVLSSSAALYAHFFFGLVLLVQFTSGILLPREFRSRTQLLHMIAVGVLGLPLLIFDVFRWGSQLDWVQPATPKEICHLFTAFTGNGVRFIIFLVAIALAFREWFRQRLVHPMQAWSFICLAAWMLLPILATLVVSRWKPMFVARFLIICLPAALLLFGEGLALVSPKPLQYPALAIVAVGSLLAARSFYRQPDPTD